MNENKKSANPNVTDELTKIAMMLQLKAEKPTDQWRDVIDDKKFPIFKKEMNEKGLE